MMPDQENQEHQAQIAPNESPHLHQLGIGQTEVNADLGRENLQEANLSGLDNQKVLNNPQINPSDQLP